MKIPTRQGMMAKDSGMGLTNAGTQVANSLSSLTANLYTTYKNEKDSSDLQDAQNKRLETMNNWKAENFQKEGEAALGMTKSYMEKQKELDAQLSSNLSSRAKKMYEGWSFQQGETDRMNVMLHEHKQDMAVKESRVKSGISIAKEMIKKDAKNYKEAAYHLESTLENGHSSGVYKSEEYATIKTEIENEFRNEMGKSYYTQDKHEFIKKLNADEFGFGKSEKAQWNEKYKTDNLADERERKSAFAEEARLIMDSKKDFSAQAIVNEDTSHYFNNAAKLRKMGYGDWASDLETEGKLYDKTIKFNQEHKNLPLAQKLKAAQDLTIGDKVEGSGLELQSRQVIQKEVAREVQEYKQDPANYVGRFAKGSTLEQVASSRLSLQRSQGLMPEKGYKVLTASEQNNYKQAFEAGDEREKTDLVLGLNYGKHTSQVLNEIGINKAVVFAPMFQNKKDIELLVSAATSKPENLSEDNKNSEYEAGAKDSSMLQMLGKVQANFPTDSDLGNTMADMKKAMVNISIKKNDPNAGKMFFDNNFHIDEAVDKMIYYPKSIDPDDVHHSLDAKKEQIAKSFLSKNSKLDTQARWAIRDFVWVNTASGFILADPKTGRFIGGSEINYNDIGNENRLSESELSAVHAKAEKAYKNLSEI